MTTIADRLKQGREAAKLTQQQVFEELEIPIRTLQNWEGGLRTPPVYVIKMLMDYYKRGEK